MENQNIAAVRPDLLAKIQQKQKERQESFTKLRLECGPLDAKAENILSLSVVELLQSLQSRKVSSSEVLRAYTKKALEVTEKFNCVTEFIPQASEWAFALDTMSSTEGFSESTALPLHGLPVAIKEDHNVEGMDTTLGFAKNLYKPVKGSAVLVKILLKLGAVPFIKTNVPQSLYSNGSDNPIFGTTLNCLNTKLSPAGSSSGSACIVAAGGTPFATGSDLGGSLRTPAHFHGICSMKPTMNRLSEKGMAQCLPTSSFFRQVPGIITPDAETLALVWRNITANNIQNQFDPLSVPIPWNEELFSAKTKLKIGYFTTLSFFPSFHDTRNTVLAAKEAFESRGHTLVKFEMPDDFHYLKVICDLLMADHGEYLEGMFSGEPVSHCVADLVESVRSLKSLESNNTHQNMTRRDKIVSGCGFDVKTAGDLWDRAHEKRVIAQDMVDRMEKDGIDLILCPAFPFPAVKLHDGYHLLSGFVYTVIWNLVDFPAGVLRFGTETGAQIDSYDDQNEPMLKSARHALSESVGMPIDVQIVGMPFKEELVLRAMIELEAVKKFTNIKL